MTEQYFISAANSCQRLLYHVAYTILRNDSDCEDAVQETLCRAWKKRHTLRDESLFRFWLTRILTNTCYTLLRKQRHDAKLMVSTAMPESTGDDLENQALHDAIGQLPVALRLTVILHYLEGFSTKEIANLMHKPEGTVRNRLHRARQQLKIFLQEEIEE